MYCNIMWFCFGVYVGGSLVLVCNSMVVDIGIMSCLVLEFFVI